MRQRNIKNLEERLELNSEFLVENPRECKGRWAEVFGNDNPIYLEIGCGKGKFILSHAADERNVNYIAVEGQSSVVLRALEKASEAQLDNLRIFIDFVHDLGDYFDKGELDGLYLNFSDPWPKARHAKRRLTFRKNLENYKTVLKEGAFIEFKTDNEGLFEFTLEEIEACGYEIVEMTRDLHGTGDEDCACEALDDERRSCDKTCKVKNHTQKQFDSANFMTEYEEKFSRAGKNINYVKF